MTRHTSGESAAWAIAHPVEFPRSVDAAIGHQNPVKVNQSGAHAAERRKD
jgi:hypothetical protein